MFCYPDPCSCAGEKKPQKRAARIAPPLITGSTGGRGIQNVDLLETGKRGPDPKEAMRFLAELEAIPQPKPPKVEQAIIDDYATGSREIADALNALEPILHPVEKEKYSSILDTPESRARRWKMRLENGSQ